LQKTMMINGKQRDVTIVIRKSPQKNLFWMHQIDIKRNTGGMSAGISKNSKTELLTSDVDTSVTRDDTDVKMDLANVIKEQLERALLFFLL